MTTLEFKTSINAPKEKVWQKLWSDEGYRKWVSVFMEGSHAESDWNEGSKIKFVGPNGDGMFAIIKRKIENKEMSFEHQGEIRNGKEEPSGWSGAQERYFLDDDNGRTELKVELQTTDDFKDYFNTTFPKALDIVKKISEE
jgi:uncharacterized protein YndB with AHSA1/START domain